MNVIIAVWLLVLDFVMAASVFIGVVSLVLLAVFLVAYKDIKNDRGLLLTCLITALFCLAVFSVAPFLRPEKSDSRKKIEAEKTQKAEETTKSAAEKLKDKLEEITGLKGVIEKKRAEVVNLKVDFANGINSLKVGIDTRKETAGIKTYSQAMNDPQIKNSLSLMQSKIAYKEKLQEIEDGLTAGHYELEHTESKTIDDLKMSTALSKEDMNRIAGQIEVVINKYAPETKKLVINEADIKIRSAQNIWDQIEKDSRPTTTVHTTTVPTTRLTTTVHTTTVPTTRPTTTVYTTTTAPTTTIYPAATTVYYEPMTTVWPTTIYPTTVYPARPEPVIIYRRPPIRVCPGPTITYPRVIRIYPGQPYRQRYRR